MASYTASPPVQKYSLTILVLTSPTLYYNHDLSQGLCSLQSAIISSSSQSWNPVRIVRMTSPSAFRSVLNSRISKESFMLVIKATLISIAVLVSYSRCNMVDIIWTGLRKMVFQTFQLTFWNMTSIYADTFMTFLSSCHSTSYSPFSVTHQNTC